MSSFFSVVSWLELVWMSRAADVIALLCAYIHTFPPPSPHCCSPECDCVCLPSPPGIRSSVCPRAVGPANSRAAARWTKRVQSGGVWAGTVFGSECMCLVCSVFRCKTYVYVCTYGRWQYNVNVSFLQNAGSAEHSFPLYRTKQWYCATVWFMNKTIRTRISVIL